MTDEEVQKMIARRKLISDSGIRRYHSDVANEGEKCFGDPDRSLDTLIQMVENGLAVLKAGRN